MGELGLELSIGDHHNISFHKERTGVIHFLGIMVSIDSGGQVRSSP